MRVSLLVLACLFATAGMASAKDKILFLHLRISSDDTVEVIKSSTRPGKLKTAPGRKGDFKLELKADDDGAILWTNAVEDARVRVFEVEDPPGSGQLRIHREVSPTAEFTVRVPLANRRARFIMSKRAEPAPSGRRVAAAAAAPAQNNILLSHPAPAATEVP